MMSAEEEDISRSDFDALNWKELQKELQKPLPEETKDPMFVENRSISSKNTPNKLLENGSRDIFDLNQTLIQTDQVVYGEIKANNEKDSSVFSVQSNESNILEQSYKSNMMHSNKSKDENSENMFLNIQNVDSNKFRNHSRAFSNYAVSETTNKEVSTLEKSQELTYENNVSSRLNPFSSNPNPKNIPEQNQVGTVGELFVPSIYTFPKTISCQSSYFSPDISLNNGFANPIFESPKSNNARDQVSESNPIHSQILHSGPSESCPSESHQSEQKGIWNILWDSKWTTQLKNATNSVLTTLDPGMEEYLKPTMSIGVGDTSVPVLHGVKSGFGKMYGAACVKGHLIPITSYPLLPVGYESAINSTTEILEYLSTVEFGFSSEYIHVAYQLFLVQLLPGRWFAMVCLGLKDRCNIVLHSFSQSVSIPNEVITILYNHGTSSNFVGFNISLCEAVKMVIPYTIDQDWCLVLTGISLKDLVSATAQCLFADYKKQTEKISLNCTDSFKFYNSDTSNVYSSVQLDLS